MVVFYGFGFYAVAKSFTLIYLIFFIIPGSCYDANPWLLISILKAQITFELELQIPEDAEKNFFFQKVIKLFAFFAFLMYF